MKNDERSAAVDMIAQNPECGTLLVGGSGIRHPEGPARVLLQVINTEPEVVMKALRG